MKCLLPLSVFVFAVLAVQMTAEAQERKNSPSVTAAPAGGSMGYVPSRNSLEKFAQKRTGGPMMPQGAFNGYSAQRLSPDYGANGSGGQGFSHFPAPLSRYSNWYRPRASTLQREQRCQPDAFRPRGLGTLFAEQRDGYRMDYQPYAVGDGNSEYGPAYFSRQQDPRCKGDCLLEFEEDQCQECRTGR